MPTLDLHQSTSLVKALVLGNSKSGKTGGMASLVKAGYHFGIVDMDNLLDPLRGFVLRECPDRIKNVHFVTFRDEYKPGPDGPTIKGTPKAFNQAMKIMDHWRTEDEDLGCPADWGPDWIFVIDSLSRLCDAAYNYFEPISGKGGRGQDKRAVYGDAQKAIEKVLANVTGEGFRTNVLVIGHLLYQSELDPSGAEILKAYPQGVGQKLSPKIPQYFPSVVHFYNKAGKRTLRTNSTPLLDLANPKPFEMSKEMPIETGLAEFFAVLRDKEPDNASRNIQTEKENSPETETTMESPQPSTRRSFTSSRKIPVNTVRGTV